MVLVDCVLFMDFFQIASQSGGWKSKGFQGTVTDFYSHWM